MNAALTMALGIGSFGDCRANSLTNFLITFQQVERFRNLGGSLQLLKLTDNGGRALHIPPVEPVGESGTMHHLLSWRCPQSRERYLL